LRVTLRIENTVEFAAGAGAECGSGKETEGGVSGGRAS
jgi:hypothetical protein